MTATPSPALCAKPTVVAVIPDSAAAIPVARTAARMAGPTGPVVLTDDGRVRLEARAAWLREEVLPPLRDLLAEPGRDERVVADYERALGELVGLEGLLAEAGPIPTASPGEVALGSRVLVRLARGSEEVVRIVHPAEAFLDEERISAASPLAAALLGCRPGESVRVLAPSGSYDCTVVGLLDEAAPVGAAC